MGYRLIQRNLMKISPQSLTGYWSDNWNTLSHVWWPRCSNSVSFSLYRVKLCPWLYITTYFFAMPQGTRCEYTTPLKIHTKKKERVSKNGWLSCGKVACHISRVLLSASCLSDSSGGQRPETLRYLWLQKNHVRKVMWNQQRHARKNNEGQTANIDDNLPLFCVSPHVILRAVC